MMAQFGDEIASLLEMRLPNNLLSMTQCSMNLIEKASTLQIEAALKHNQEIVNKFLVKLLTIQFISKHQTIITNDLNQIQNQTHNNNNNNNTTNDNLAKYCETKLLKLSPILGFTRKDY